MNLNDLGTQLLFTTVPFWSEKTNGNTEVGTAFFYIKNLGENKSIPFLITNYHVVKDSKRGFIALIRSDGQSPISTERITVELEGNKINQFVDKDNDIAAFPIGPVLNELESRGIKIFFRSITPEIIPSDEVINNLSAIEDITFIGYPSGLFDRKNNSPLIRRGVSATPIWNDFEGHPKFLIDAGVYPGSSGSPVLIFNTGSYPTKDGLTIGNRILFIGIITETIMKSVASGSSEVYLGLGVVLKSSKIKEFIDSIVSKIEI